MTDLQTYLESGIIEAYCLGQLDIAEMREVDRIAGLYPVVREEIIRTDLTLRQLATESPALQTRKKNILHTLQQLRLEEEISPENLPLLTPYSDYRKWLAFVHDRQPTTHEGGLHFCTLQERPNLVQNLTWLDDFLQEDGHAADDFEESFLLLEGECECNIGGKIFRLSAGDYLTIPANVTHSIQNLRPGQPLIGIIQRYKAAA